MPKQSRKRSGAQRVPRTERRAEAETSVHATREQGPEAELGLVRDAARPLVERTLLALHVEPHDPERLARFVEILERSRLPEAHRASLVDRLRSDQAAADAISASVRSTFGDDGPAVREALIRSLESLEDLLSRDPGDRAWSLGPDRALPLPDAALHGGLSARAEALVGALAEASHAPLPEGARPDSAGAAFTRLCSLLPLMLPWEEEDEEPVIPALDEG